MPSPLAKRRRPVSEATRIWKQLVSIAVRQEFRNDPKTARKFRDAPELKRLQPLVEHQLRLLAKRGIPLSAWNNAKTSPIDVPLLTVFSTAAEMGLFGWAHRMGEPYNWIDLFQDRVDNKQVNQLKKLLKLAPMRELFGLFLVLLSAAKQMDLHGSVDLKDIV